MQLTKKKEGKTHTQVLSNFACYKGGVESSNKNSYFVVGGKEKGSNF